MSTPRRIEILDDRIQCVTGLFGPEECDALIHLAHGVGFDAAPVTTGRGFVMMPELRNNTRVMLDDLPRAAALWHKIRPFIPERVGRARAVGLNERFRFYRYGPGQYFRWHHDGAFVRDERERSLFTVMVYLNEGFEGGATEFDLAEGEQQVV